MNADRRSLRLGTRGSELALWQARHVAERLARSAPPIEIVPLRTQGDLVLDVPLGRVPGKAFFTDELDRALLAGEIDLAVHSLKDVATTLPRGLALAAVLARADARDVLVSRHGEPFDALPLGARIGTSSLRRRALLRRWRSDVEVVEMRGNVPTRLQKLDAGEYDAVVLAAAGLERLGLSARIAERLPLERVLPAAGQGAIAIAMRQDDHELGRRLASLDDVATRAATRAERALLGRLEGGCQVPVGCLGGVVGANLELRAIVCSLDGRRAVERQLVEPIGDPEALGERLARRLLADGAAEILAEIRERPPVDGP